MKLVKRAKTNLANNRIILVFVISFALVGVILLIQSSAASPHTAVEPEKGSLSGTAKIITDSNASGGQAVQFNAPSGNPNQFGFNADWCLANWVNNVYTPCTRTEALARLDDMVAMGVKWVRYDVNWPTVQSGGPNSFDFSGYDDYIRQAENRGLKVLVQMNYAPSWAKSLNMADYATAYGKYVAAVATHYENLANSTDQTQKIKQPITYFELGNEEDLNNGTFGSSVPITSYPEAVARKEYSAYKAIKGVASSYNTSFTVISAFSGNICPTTYSVVINGVNQNPDEPCGYYIKDTKGNYTGAVNPNGNGHGWDGVNFLRAFYAKVSSLKASGAVPSDFDTNHMYDALAYHPYCWDHQQAIGTETGVCPWNEMVGAGDVASHDPSQWTIRGLMNSHGESSKKIWATEAGFAWFYDANQARDQQRQADSITYVYNYVQQHSSDYGPLFWYSYENWPGTASTDEQWGVYSGNNEITPISQLTQLPGYKAYKAAAQAAAK